jgi:hypothetical protein
MVVDQVEQQGQAITRSLVRWKLDDKEVDGAEFVDVVGHGGSSSSGGSWTRPSLFPMTVASRVLRVVTPSG